jgi:uncharacterized protein (DUF58 family)
MYVFSKYSVRFWGIVLLFLVSMLFLLFQGGKLAAMVFSIVAALTLYTLLGRWSGISKTRGIRTLDTIQGGAIEAGSLVAVHIKVSIPGFWPVPYITIKERLKRRDGEVYTIETILVSGWKRQAEVSYETPPMRRGVYSFEDTICETEDIFGLIRHQGRLQLPFAFKVFPQKVNIQEWKQLHQIFRGKSLSSAKTRLYRETAQVNGIREYVKGDRMSRIHWRATAKTRAWKSKDFERETVPNVVFILDRNKSVYRNQDQFELGVSVAASLLDYTISRDMAVGVLSAGKESKIFKPKRGESQRNVILNHLIEAESDGMNTLLDILQEQVRAFAPGTLFVVITPQFGEALVTSLTLLQQHRMNLCHMWIATEVLPAAQEQWSKYLRTTDFPGYMVTSLDQLPLVVGGNK